MLITNTMDKNQIIIYLKKLNLEKYYPHQQIKPATQYFIEELFEDVNLTGS